MNSIKPFEKSTQTDDVIILQSSEDKELWKKKQQDEFDAWVWEGFSFGGGNGPIHSASGPSYEPGAFPYAPAKPSTDPRPPPWLSTTIEPTSNRKPLEIETIAFARLLQQKNKDLWII